MSHPLPTYELENPETKYDDVRPGKLEDEFGNIIDCICPKKLVGAGWYDGKWRNGVLCKPHFHNDECPEFEDYSGDIENTYE